MKYYDTPEFDKNNKFMLDKINTIEALGPVGLEEGLKIDFNEMEKEDEMMNDVKIMKSPVLIKHSDTDLCNISENIANYQKEELCSLEQVVGSSFIKSQKKIGDASWMNDSLIGVKSYGEIELSEKQKNFIAKSSNLKTTNILTSNHK